MTKNLLYTLILQAVPTNLTESVNVADSVRVAAQNIAEEIVNDPSAFVENLIQALVDFGLKLLAALAIYLIGAWVIKRLKRSLTRILEKRNTEQTLASFISSIVSLLLTVLLVLLTIGALGVNTTSIAAMLGAGAMAIGMALSGTMENFAGGLIILMFKPFKAGDFISVNGNSGFVTDVSIVSTKITTPDNRCIIIPNGSLSNGTIDNYSARPLRRVEWKLGVEYGTDADAMMAAMMEIAKEDKRILNAETPGAMDPYVALSSLNDSDITFMLRAWVRSEEYWDVFHDMNKTLYTELPQRGFSFAFPHMDVRVKNEA